MQNAGLSAVGPRSAARHDGPIMTLLPTLDTSDPRSYPPPSLFSRIMLLPLPLPLRVEQLPPPLLSLQMVPTLPLLRLRVLMLLRLLLLVLLLELVPQLVLPR